ncbi:MAG: SEC-C metal-binding domain-containing protein [Nanoarchaeota archaeon]
MAILYFNCKKCNKEFKSDVGKIKVNHNQTLTFQREALCSYCGESSKESIEVTKENTAVLCDIYDEQERKRVIKEYLPGKLVNYSVIFGRETKISLKLNSSDYYVSDNYCVARNCDCTNAIIDFYLKNNENKPANWSFSLTYDYSKGSIFDLEGIDEKQAKEIIDLLVMNMQIPFKQRHYEIKRFFYAHISNKISKYYKNNKSQVKIGRNEPCPCGSGKKYKKCCLEKESK